LASDDGRAAPDRVANNDRLDIAILEDGGLATGNRSKLVHPLSRLRPIASLAFSFTYGVSYLHFSDLNSLSLLFLHEPGFLVEGSFKGLTYLIKSAAFSPIIMQVAFVGLLIISGIMEASATLSPAIP
jgi:hypothetical protein